MPAPSRSNTDPYSSWRSRVTRRTRSPGRSAFRPSSPTPSPRRNRFPREFPPSSPPRAGLSPRHCPWDAERGAAASAREPGSERHFPPVRPEDGAHDVGDLPQGRVRAHGVEDRLHPVGRPAARLLQRGAGRLDRLVVPLLPQGRKPPPLVPLDLRVHGQKLLRLPFPDREVVDPDDDPVLAL